MVCLGLEPGAAEWKAQTNLLSYGSSPIFDIAKCQEVLRYWSFQRSQELLNEVRAREAVSNDRGFAFNIKALTAPLMQTLATNSRIH